jgi:hypothetical protein
MLGNATDKAYTAGNTVTQFDESLFVELNQNYYYDILPPDVSVYGTLEPGFYKKFFPLDSVVKGWRPTSGVYKPRKMSWGQATTYGLKGTKGWRNNITENSTPQLGASTGQREEYIAKPRVYWAREGQTFKYWDSPVVIASSAYVHPWIEYTADVKTNKISVTFQNVMGSPVRFKIQYKTNAGSGGTWVDALDATGADYSMPSTGVVEVYRSSGSWTQSPTTYLLTDAISIRQIRVFITKMSDPAIHPSIIEMSPRLYIDMSDRLKDWSFDANIAESNSVLPVGTVSSNSGSVTLSNNDNELEPTNAGGGTLRYADLMRKYAKVVVKLKAVTAGSSWVEAGTAYIEKATPSGNKTVVNVTLFDYAKFLQDQPAPDVCMNQVSPTAAIRQLLDTTGHTNVLVKRVKDQSEPIMRWFWSNSEETVWDAIQKICESHQYAVYINEKNQIVIMTKEYIYLSSTAVYAATTEGTTLSAVTYVPNVQDISNNKDEPINAAYVTFRPKSLSSEVDPDPAKYAATNQVAFSRIATRDLYVPDQPILLGVAPMIQTMDSSQNYLYINPTSLAGAGAKNSLDGNGIPRIPLWGGFSGYLLIDQEIIKYDGLELAYTAKAGSPAGPQIAKSPEQWQEIINYAQGSVVFTGKVCNLERGQFNTTAAAHTLSTTGWTSAQGVVRRADETGNGYLCIRNSTAGAKRLNWTVKNIQSNGNWVNTKMVIDTGLKTAVQAGGIVLSATLSGANLSTGLYVEANQIGDGGVSLYTISNNIIAAAPIATVKFNIPDGGLFDLSVYIARGATSTSRIVSVYVNRSRVLSKTFTTTVPLTSLVGLGSSGNSSVKFDYICGGSTTLGDEQSKFDGSIKAYVESVLKIDRGQQLSRAMPDLASIGFERFDDYVRQMFVEDVSFSKTPALSADFVATSSIVKDPLSRQSIASGDEVAGAIANITSFSAKVLIANVSSRSLLLVFTDESGGSTNYPRINGIHVNEFEEVRISKRDEASVNRIGEKKVDFNPRWITSRSNAESVSSWIVSRCKDGVDRITATIWAGHLLQLGDVLYVHSPSDQKNISANYVVVGANKSGSGGNIATSVDLVKI